MAKLRVIILLITIAVMAVFGTALVLYARGYRFDPTTLTFAPRGLLVANSDPNGAQVFIDGELTTATNATIPLAPGTYDVRIQDEGLYPWEKRLVVEKEVVTKVDVTLFPTAASLTPVTFSGAFNPVPSSDFTKIAYGVPTEGENGEKAGLWISEVVNLPIGFTREPRQITDGDLSEATWQFSPDGREILLSTTNSVYLLDTSRLTPQNQLVNMATQKDEVLEEWEEKREKRLSSQLGKLPDELVDILERKAVDIVFSPDESRVIYTASGSAEIPQDLAKELPGASTQKQTRNTKDGKKYIYDIKEDRNFEVGDGSQATYWLPTSQHIIIPEKNKVLVKDFDGTNAIEIYSGSYVFPHAYSFSTGSNLLILTSLGSTDSPANLYSLSLK